MSYLVRRNILFALLLLANARPASALPTDDCDCDPDPDTDPEPPPPPITTRIEAFNFRDRAQTTLDGVTQYFSGQHPFDIQVTAQSSAGVAWVRAVVDATAYCEGSVWASNGSFYASRAVSSFGNQANGSSATTTLATRLTIDPRQYGCGSYPLARVELKVIANAADVRGTAASPIANQLTYVKTLRVATYNIQYGGGNYFPLTADHIKAQQPDIVILQEVDKNYRAESHYEDQPARLGSMLGMPYVFDYTSLGTPPWYCSLFIDDPICRYPYRYSGMVILSRFPMSQHQYTAYRPVDDYRQGFQEVVVDVGGVPMRIGNTHLMSQDMADHRGLNAGAERMAQTSILLSKVGVPSIFTVLAGDYNAGLGEAEMNMIANAGFQEVCQLKSCMNGGSTPVDHIFIYNPSSAASSRFRLMEGNVVMVPYEPSDHQLKLARFSIVPYW